MIFQAILAPALVLCGALLYGSNLVLATGKSICGRIARFGRPFLGLTFSCRVLGCYVKGLRGVHCFSVCLSNTSKPMFTSRVSPLSLLLSRI